MRRLAQSALEEHGSSECSEGLVRAARGDEKHAERDLLRLFSSLGMSLNIPISHYRFGLTMLPHLKLRAWWEYLLKSRSSLALAGFHRHQQEAELALKCFWDNLRSCMPDHQVFQSHGDRLETCVPYCLFLDEGTSLRKSAVLVISMQPVLGTSTAAKFSDGLRGNGKRKRSRDSSLDPAALKQLMAQSQAHNGSGRTYSSRFLYSVLPKKVYHKNDRMDRLLEKLADECTGLMSAGVRVGSTTFYPVCLGVKGDAPMLIRVGHLNRGFSHMGKNKGCCFECLAGTAGYHFEDVRWAPDWEGSMYSVRPYSDPSPLLRIPAQTVPEKFFRRDPFHTFKQSIGCTFISSSIVLLCDLGYFPGESEAVAEQLSRAYCDFTSWVKKEWRGKTVQSMRAFTKELFHWPRKEAYPAGRFKGSDCLLLLRWIQHILSFGFVVQNVEPLIRTGRSPITHPLEAWHRPLLEAILKGCGGGLKFFHLLHRNGVWVSRETTREMSLSALSFTQSFSALASLCHSRNLPRYHLVPSLHAMHHFFIDSKKSLATRPRSEFTLNPAVFNCEADDDFVGKVARLTRKVHARTTSLRTLERYRVKMWCEQQDLR